MGHGWVEHRAEAYKPLGARVYAAVMSLDDLLCYEFIHRAQVAHRVDLGQAILVHEPAFYVPSSMDDEVSTAEGPGLCHEIGAGAALGAAPAQGGEALSRLCS